MDSSNEMWCAHDDDTFSKSYRESTAGWKESSWYKLHKKSLGIKEKGEINW